MTFRLILADDMPGELRAALAKKWYELHKERDPHHCEEYEETGLDSFRRCGAYPFELFITAPLVVAGLDALEAALPKRGRVSPFPSHTWPSRELAEAFAASEAAGEWRGKLAVVRVEDGDGDES